MKFNLPSLSRTVALIAIATALMVPAIRAQQPPTINFRGATNQNLESLDAVKKGFDTFGRKLGEAPTNRPAPPEAPVLRPAPAPSGRNAVEIRTSLVQLIKSVPAQVGLGETYDYDLTVTALDDVGNVIVTDTIPAGATYVRSEPPATHDGDTLTWKYPVMHRGDINQIKVWLKADREGDLTGCATIAAVPRRCVTTVVGKAVLEIVKTGPETALLGADVSYKVLVTNRGNTAAKNVVVTDTLPEGLTYAGGLKEVTVDMGDIAPNQAKTFTLPVKASKRGRFVNTATANSSNAGRVSAEAATTVVQPGLKITKTGDRQGVWLAGS